MHSEPRIERRQGCASSKLKSRSGRTSEAVGLPRDAAAGEAEAQLRRGVFAEQTQSRSSCPCGEANGREVEKEEERGERDEAGVDHHQLSRQAEGEHLLLARTRSTCLQAAHSRPRSSPTSTRPLSASRIITSTRRSHHACTKVRALLA